MMGLLTLLVVGVTYFRPVSESISRVISLGVDAADATSYEPPSMQASIIISWSHIANTAVVSDTSHTSQQDIGDDGSPVVVTLRVFLWALEMGPFDSGQVSTW